MAPRRMSAGSKKSGKAAVETSPTESTGDVAVLTSASALMSLSHGPRCCGKQWPWQLVSTSFLKTLDGFSSTRKMTRSISETQSYGSVLQIGNADLRLRLRNIELILYVKIGNAEF